MIACSCKHRKRQNQTDATDGVPESLRYIRANTASPRHHEQAGVPEVQLQGMFLNDHDEIRGNGDNGDEHSLEAMYDQKDTDEEGIGAGMNDGHEIKDQELEGVADVISTGNTKGTETGGGYGDV